MGKGQKDIALHSALHAQHPSSGGHATADMKYVNASKKHESTSQQLQLLSAFVTVAYKKEKIDRARRGDVLLSRNGFQV